MHTRTWRTTALAAVALTASCSSDDTSSSLTVIVDTNYGLRLQAVVAAVLDPTDDSVATEHRFEAGEHALPLSFGVVPESADAGLKLSVSAMGAAGELSTRVAHTDVDAEASMVLALFLDRDCEQTTCPSDETCTEVGCEPIDVVTQPVVPGQELDGLCRPGEAWCDDDGSTLVECPRFGAAPNRSRCANGCVSGATACSGPDTPDDHSMVTVSAGANGRVISAPAGILCGTTCTATFPTGSTVWLQALPDVGFEVDTWSASCAASLSQRDRCAVVVDDDTNAGVTFRAVAN